MLTKLIELECIKKGEFVLKSGKTSEYYIDLRKLVSYPKILKELCDLIIEKIDSNIDLICGCPYAGIPYASCISLKQNIPMILLRKEQKKYGTKKMIEGEFSQNNNLLLIDDILTSGTSLIESMNYLKNFNIKQIIVIFDREEGGKEKIENLGYNVISLFSTSDLREHMKL